MPIWSMAGLSRLAALTAGCSCGGDLCHHVRREASRFISSILYPLKKHFGAARHVVVVMVWTVRAAFQIEGNVDHGIEVRKEGLSPTVQDA